MTSSKVQTKGRLSASLKETMTTSLQEGQRKVLNIHTYLFLMDKAAKQKVLTYSPTYARYMYAGLPSKS